MEKSNQGHNQSNIWKILFAVFLTAAVIGLAVTCVQVFRKNRAERELEQLVGQTYGSVEDMAADESASIPQPEISATEPSSVSVEQPADDSMKKLNDLGISIPEKEVDLADLQTNVNRDIYAWIYIPDSMIDYPVLQHPTDNAYYLNYNLDGSKGYPGCIYTENYNEKDFSDPNTVLYGHNMKNGTMFAGLHKFEDSEYFEEHPYVYIYTAEKLYVYEIFAAYETNNEHILLNNDFTDNYSFRKYLDSIFAIRDMNSNRRDDMTVTAENHILTLSTCVANQSDRRYLVQGVLLNED